MEYPQRELLLKLDELTEPKHRRQERDALRAEDVAEAAGLALVGEPDTRMALAMRAFAELAKIGLVMRAKDEEGGGGIKYRVSQLGERELHRERLRAERREREEIEQALAERDRLWQAAEDERANLQREVALLSAPPWWKFWARADA